MGINWGGENRKNLRKNFNPVFGPIIKLWR
jgi:hypothetical protein